MLHRLSLNAGRIRGPADSNLEIVHHGQSA